MESPSWRGQSLCRLPSLTHLAVLPSRDDRTKPNRARALMFVHDLRRAENGGPHKEDHGADERIRTADLLITNQLLYQLSYVGLGFCARGRKRGGF